MFLVTKKRLLSNLLGKFKQKPNKNNDKRGVSGRVQGSYRVVILWGHFSYTLVNYRDVTTGLPRFPADVRRMEGGRGDPSTNNHPKGELRVKVRQ